MQVARTRRGVTLLTALLVALLAVGNAYADTRVIADRNDRPGPLDIRSASHAHDGARIVHTISTFSRWPLGLIGPNTSNLLAVEISTDGDPALERVVLVFSANGRLVAPIIRLPAGTVVGYASASKPNGRTVRVSIPRRHSETRAATAGMCIRNTGRPAPVVGSAPTERPTQAGSSTTSQRRGSPPGASRSRFDRIRLNLYHRRGGRLQTEQLAPRPSCVWGDSMVDRRERDDDRLQEPPPCGCGGCR